MNKNIFYSLVLFLLGLGFLAGAHSDLQSIAYSGICFLFLSFPLIGQMVKLATSKAKSTAVSTEESPLGIGA
jgi:hypothetical protein